MELFLFEDVSFFVFVFFDELSVDSNPQRLNSVRLDRCLLELLLPCGFCEVSSEGTDVAAE